MYDIFGVKSSRAFRVIWALEELGQSYTHHDTLPRSDAAYSLNPSGKVPILKDDDLVITDSSAILVYLAEKHGTLLAPPATAERATQLSRFHMFLDELDAVLWTAARHSFILPEERRVPDVKASLKFEFAQSLERFEKNWNEPFAAGAEFSIADILLCHCLDWAQSAKFAPASERLTSYVKTMQDRPAYQRMIAAGQKA